jgi:hypothetical protein
MKHNFMASMGHSVWLRAFSSLSSFGDLRQVGTGRFFGGSLNSRGLYMVEGTLNVGGKGKSI